MKPYLHFISEAVRKRFSPNCLNDSLSKLASVTVYAADYAGNTASEDCPYRVAGDRDDVESAVEDGAPNGGDGNAPSGIADTQCFDAAGF